jgi:hypothetical protein
MNQFSGNPQSKLDRECVRAYYLTKHTWRDDYGGERERKKIKGDHRHLDRLLIAQQEATIDLDVLAGYSAVAVPLRFPEVVERGYSPVPALARVEGVHHTRSMPCCPAATKRNLIDVHIMAVFASALH